MADRVRVERDGRVAVVTLDDPARRNALDLPFCDELVATFDALEADDGVGAVVLTGAPPAFCAGADLFHLGAVDTEAISGTDDGSPPGGMVGGTPGDGRSRGSAREGLMDIYEGFLRVARCPRPTVAAVNGAAVGAGMNLALVCDLRLAGRSARFDTRFLQLGLHPGGGHTWMLQRIVGPQVAKAMLLFGAVLDGEPAAAAGLAWRCVDDDALLDTAMGMASHCASQPHELARRLKATVNDMWDVEAHDVAVTGELVDQLWSLDQPDFAERLAALQAKVSSKPTP